MNFHSLTAKKNRIDTSLQLRDVGYDNNFYQMREEDDPVGDYTATVSLPFTVYLPYRNSIVAFLNIGIGLTLNYWKRDSNILGLGRSRGFIGGYLTYDF